MKIGTFSRILLVTVVSLVACAAGAAAENAEYAPLIEKDTALIARIDLTKIDFAATTKTVSKTADPFIDAFVPDKEKSKQTKASLPLMLGMYVGQFATVVDQFKSAGVTNIYVVYGAKEEKMSESYIAIPVGTKTKEECKPIRAAFSAFDDLNITTRFPFVRHGFMIAPIVDPEQDDDDAIKAYVKKRFMTLETVSRPEFARGFEGQDGKTLTIVSVFSEKTLDELAKSIDGMEDNEFVKQGGDVAKKSAVAGRDFLKNTVKTFAGVSYGLDLSTLAYTVRLRLKSTGDVANVRDEFAKISEKTSQNADDAELAKQAEKMIQSLKPTINGDTLEWKLDPSFLDSNRDFFIAVIKKGMAQTNAAKK